MFRNSNSVPPFFIISFIKHESRMYKYNRTDLKGEELFKFVATRLKTRGRTEGKISADSSIHNLDSLEMSDD